jgi:allophanate hydrolase
MIGRTMTPGDFMSIRRKEMPDWGLALGSVRTRQKIQSACCAQAVLAVLDRFDPEDPFARPGDRGRDAQPTKDFAFGRLASEAVETFGAPECRELYETACTRLTRSGGRPVEIDFSPFLEAGRMLFDGPWIAERAGSLASFLAAHPDAVLPEIARVLAAAKRITAADVFAAQRQILRLRRTVDELLTSVGTIMVPTAPRPFLIDELRAEPIAANSRAGYYTHAANLLDLCAISVPNTITASGVDMGVTLFWRRLAGRGHRSHRRVLCGDERMRHQAVSNRPR